MGEYHLTGDIISRGGGRNGNPRSAVASAAYRSGTSLFNEYDGEQKDFSRKGNVTYSEILLPDNAPKELQDRGKLWNYVEMFEKRANAQLARQIEFSLPVELSPEERLNAARDMAEYFRAQGMAVDLNIHEPDHETPKEKTQRLSKITEAISDYDNNSLFKSGTDMMMKYRSLNGREKEKFHAKNETEIERGKIYVIKNFLDK